MALGSLVAGCGEEATQERSDEAVTVVKTYVEARAAGDARKACAQLSKGQQYELVARVTGDFRSASPDKCEKFVLEPSSRSTAVRPELVRFLSAVLYKRPGKAGSVTVGPVDSREFLELINEGGTWKIDGQAAEKESFVRYHCPGMGYDRSVCACIYEELRRADSVPYHSHTSQSAFRQALGEGVRKCTGSGPDNPPI